jgi:hypothetical protein
MPAHSLAEASYTMRYTNSLIYLLVLVDVSAYDLSDEQAAQLADQLLSWFLNEYPKLRPPQTSHQEPGQDGDRGTSPVL